jgi:methylenetetrahydrofolate dehydrogenase (NADP+)/methenyltetrahydrofolate cyclohydrolase
MTRLIEGKPIVAHIREEIKAEIIQLKETYGVTPGLVVVIVGEDPSSQIYVNNKHKACQEMGMYSEIIRLPEDCTEEHLLAVIEQLNQRQDVHGILVQLPLPKHINEGRVLEAIDPTKDVDGFHPINTGRLFSGQPTIYPCTAYGIIKLLEISDIPIKGKHAVIVGRSNIVGKPTAMMLMERHATITICHSRTENLAEITRQADILVTAIGKPCFITGDMVKEGVVVIDAGINRTEGKKIYGDVDFASVSPKASAITPVPGGVGLLTVTMLLYNTVACAKRLLADSIA